MAPKGAGRYFENVNWIVPIWFNTHKHTCAHMHLDRYVYMIHLFMMKLWQILCMILRACSGKNKQTRAHTCAQTQTYKHTQTHACKHFCTHASRQGTFIWFIYLGSNYVCYAMTIIIYDMCIPLLGECHTRDYLIYTLGDCAHCMRVAHWCISSMLLQVSTASSSATASRCLPQPRGAHNVIAVDLVHYRQVLALHTYLNCTSIIRHTHQPAGWISRPPPP